jgi:hypothetical protein
MQQRLGEQQDQLHNANYWVFFLMFSRNKFWQKRSHHLHSSIRQLSLVLEAAKEKERTLEESVKSLQVHIGASNHSSEDISAMHTISKNIYRSEYNDIGAYQMTSPSK